MKRRLIVYGAALAVLALAMTVAGGITLCHGVLRVPRRPPGALLPGGREVSLAARDGVVLRATFVPAQGSGGRCAMVLHGIADSRLGVAGFAPLLVGQGYSTLLPDNRAHGASGGEFVTYGLLEKHDALAWAQWLREQGCSAIYGLGESLGAAVLIQAAAEQPAFRAIVAECSFSDLRRVGRDRVRSVGIPGAPAALLVESAALWARLRYGFDLRQASPAAAIARTSTPILLIHGLADDRTPPAHSEALARANPHAGLWLVQGAGHVDASLADPSAFRDRVLGWFARW